MALSTNSLLLLDQRTLQIKYRIPATEIYRLSLSPYHDNIAVFHVKAVSNCTSYLELINSIRQIPNFRLLTVGNVSKERRFRVPYNACDRSDNETISGDSKCNGTSTGNSHRFRVSEIQTKKCNCTRTVSLCFCLFIISGLR